MADILKGVLTNGVTYLVVSLLLPAIVAALPVFRRWLFHPRDDERPYAAAAVAAMAGLSTALLAVAIFWFVAPVSLSIVPQRFGPGGGAAPNKNEGEFTKASIGGAERPVARLSEFPICSLSQVSIPNEGGFCSLTESEDHRDWTVHVDGGARCKVTCFKLQLDR